MKRLNMDKLNSRISAFVDTETALKDVTPVEWPKDVLAGDKKIIVSQGTVEEKDRCVKLVIS